MSATNDRPGGFSPASDPEAIREKLDKLLRHIELVRATALLLGEKLIQQGDMRFGLDLIANSLAHDQSKFHGIEWEYLVGGTFDNEATRLAASHHVRTNLHHPEYWGGIEQMPRIHVAEMVCDWYARSMEFGENVRDFVRERAMERFAISRQSKVYRWIKEFLDLILEKPFRESPR